MTVISRPLEEELELDDLLNWSTCNVTPDDIPSEAVTVGKWLSGKEYQAIHQLYICESDDALINNVVDDFRGFIAAGLGTDDKVHAHLREVGFERVHAEAEEARMIIAEGAAACSALDNGTEPVTCPILQSKGYGPLQDDYLREMRWIPFHVVHPEFVNAAVRSGTHPTDHVDEDYICPFTVAATEARLMMSFVCSVRLLRKSRQKDHDHGAERNAYVMQDGEQLTFGQYIRSTYFSKARFLKKFRCSKESYTQLYNTLQPHLDTMMSVNAGRRRKYSSRGGRSNITGDHRLCVLLMYMGGSKICDIASFIRCGSTVVTTMVIASLRLVRRILGTTLPDILSEEFRLSCARAFQGSLHSHTYYMVPTLNTSSVKKRPRRQSSGFLWKRTRTAPTTPSAAPVGAESDHTGLIAFAKETYGVLGIMPEADTVKQKKQMTKLRKAAMRAMEEGTRRAASAFQFELFASPESSGSDD